MTLWTLVAGGTAAGGLLAAALQLPWQSLVAVFLASGLLAASLALSTDAVATDTIDLGRSARAGVVTGLVVVVAIGLAGVLGAPGVALVVLVLVTRPGLVTGVRAALARRRERSAGAEPEVTSSQAPRWPQSAVSDGRDDAWERTVPGSLATDPEPFAGVPFADSPLDTAPDWSPTLTVPTHLSDQDLCLAWESSSRALRRCTTPNARLEVVRVRQACLDELERRQPEAVRAWVLAGADPDSSPARYLAS